MRSPHRFGGTGQFRLTRSACSGGVLLAGEAAGFQDALWGFGIRYALLSGCLAARALLSGADYDRLWKRRFGGLQRTSVVNRYFFARMGHPGYRWLMRALRRAPDPREWLRRFYAPSRLEIPLGPDRRPRSTAGPPEAVTGAHQLTPRPDEPRNSVAGGDPFSALGTWSLAPLP